MEHAANHGAGAVRADQQIAFGDVPVRGPQRDTVVRHREPGRFAVERRRVLPDRLQQGAVHSPGRKATTVGPPIASGKDSRQNNLPVTPAVLLCSAL